VSIPRRCPGRAASSARRNTLNEADRDVRVHTVRGGVVHQDALVRALREGWIGAAEHDV
jgi:phosphoglycerate dehydrogenase-like enzyme